MSCLRVTKLVQQIYDHNFKDKTLEWIKYTYAGIDITIYPNGIDYDAGNKVHQVKWEIHYIDDHKIINLSCPLLIESPLAIVLTEYINNETKCD